MTISVTLATLTREAPAAAYIAYRMASLLAASLNALARESNLQADDQLQEFILDYFGDPANNSDNESSGMHMNSLVEL